MIVHSFTFTPLADNDDFDRDRDVDGRDFLTWQRGLGADATNLAGDADYNGAVNGTDFAIWAQQFGAHLDSELSQTPEPATNIMLALAAYFIWRMAL